MRKFLLFLIFAFIIFLTWSTQCNTVNEQFRVDGEKRLNNYPFVPFKQGYPLLEEINIRNNKINSLKFDVDMIIKIDKSFRLTGTVAYSKPEKFRMMMSTILGKELDIGSNNEHFWYWSKHGEPSALHFVNRSEINKAKLKSPFDPKFLLGALSITQIDYEGAKIDSYNGNWRIIKEANGQNITTCITVDPIKKLIIGRSVYDKAGTLTAASEVKSWQIVNDHHLPRTITMIWYEEKVNVNLTLKFPVVNRIVNDSMWVMPNINPKIDMGKD